MFGSIASFFLSKIGKQIAIFSAVLFFGYYGIDAIKSFITKAVLHDTVVLERDAAIFQKDAAIAARDLAEKRREDDRLKDAAIRKQFYKNEYEEINRYKKRLEEVEALSNWHNTPLPDDVKRMRESKGTVHSEQRVSESPAGG